MLIFYICIKKHGKNAYLNIPCEYIKLVKKNLSHNK